jgi:ribosomal protein S18 acetylase RimI-like enzyme
MDSIEKKFTIRKLQVEDADAISEIYSLITQKPHNANFKKVIQEHATKESHEAHFVTEIDGKVVGFMISYLLPLGFGAGKNAYIATMGVHPKHMGGGIGARMTREVFKFYQSQGIHHVYTSVRWDSTDLLSFCKTMGFERSEFINLKKDL